MGGDCISKLDYVPVLIVSKDLDGNFVHMREADVDTIYYCPCCGAKVKIRADNSEKTQRHFYHFEGSKCSSESVYHWLYKNWLFTENSKFIIDGASYMVSQIFIERAFETKFGLYRPDIYVESKEGVNFFFEINYSSKKDPELSCKWNCFNFNVVEVDIRDLLLADFNQSTPEFKLIFKDGEYLKKYQERKKRDVYSSTILDYKKTITNDLDRFDRLDDIWVALAKYKAMKESLDNVVDIICEEDNKDLLFCMKLIKRIKCIDVYEKCKEQINKQFIKNLEDTKDLYFDKCEVCIEQKSSQIYYIIGKFKDSLDDMNVYDYFYIRFRSTDGIFTTDLLEGDLSSSLKQLRRRYAKFRIVKNVLKNKYDNVSLSWNETLLYRIHKDDYYVYKNLMSQNEMCLKYLQVLVTHSDFIFQEGEKEDIGLGRVDFYNLMNYDYDKEHAEYLKKAEHELKISRKKEALRNNDDFSQLIEELTQMVSGTGIQIYLSVENLRLIIAHGGRFEFDLFDIDTQDFSISKFEENTKKFLEILLKVINIVSEFNNQINSCRNKIWYSESYVSYNGIRLKVGLRSSHISEHCSVSYNNFLDVGVLEKYGMSDSTPPSFAFDRFEAHIRELLEKVMRKFFIGIEGCRLMEVCG